MLVPHTSFHQDSGYSGNCLIRAFLAARESPIARATAGSIAREVRQAPFCDEIFGASHLARALFEIG